MQCISTRDLSRKQAQDTKNPGRISASQMSLLGVQEGRREVLGEAHAGSLCFKGFAESTVSASGT
jgi:hypothetical protein